jgi:hypothetical protein
VLAPGLSEEWFSEGYRGKVLAPGLSEEWFSEGYRGKGLHLQSHSMTVSLRGDIHSITNQLFFPLSDVLFKKNW